MTDWITLENLADYLDRDELPLQMSELSISAACAAVRKYLDQEITFVEADEEWHDGTGKPLMRVRQRPIRDLIAVTVDDTELVQDEDFEVRGSTLRRLDGYDWPRGKANVIVEYDHGWDAEESSDAGYLPVPADIQLVTLSIAARALRGMTADPTMRSETIGQYSYQRDSTLEQRDILMTEAAVLDRYAVRLVP